MSQITGPQTTLQSTIRIIVTGDHQDFDSRFPSELGHQGRPLEWISLPVLRFERLAVDRNILEQVTERPFDWIVFTSPRSVNFWSEVLLENGLDFPVETQVACIGIKTAEFANNDG